MASVKHLPLNIKHNEGYSHFHSHFRVSLQTVQPAAFCEGKLIVVKLYKVVLFVSKLLHEQSTLPKIQNHCHFDVIVSIFMFLKCGKRRQCLIANVSEIIFR